MLSTVSNKQESLTNINKTPSSGPGKLSDVGQITSREELLAKSLLEFFSKPYNLNQLLPILNGTSPIAKHTCDWMTSNYSKQYDVILDIKKGDNVRYFPVYNNYKAQLKGYGKKLFDPFGRGKKIVLLLGKTEIQTTVGQLNYFRWAIENKVLDYIYHHLDEINSDRVLRGPKVNKNPNKKHTKHQLSVSATKSITKHNVTVTVKFD